MSSTASNYALNLAESWRAQLGTSASTRDEIAFAGVVLSNGDVVLAGVSAPSGEISDGVFGADGTGNFTAYRLDTSTGEQVWRYEATTGTEFQDVFFAAGVAGGGGGGAAYDGEGGAVVLGGSTEGNWTAASLNGNAQIAAVKVDARSGQEMWRFQDVPDGVNAVTPGTGRVLGVAGDPEGNYFLVGLVVGRLTAASGAAGDSDFFVIKLDGATGGVIWRLQDGTPSEDDVFFAATCDSAGNLIAAGYTSGGYGAGVSGGGYDYVAAKYSPDGEEIWRYQAGSEQDETFRAVTVDGGDNVYLGGGFEIVDSEAGNARDPVVHKLDGATGELLWTYSGSTSTNTNTTKTIFRSLAVDPTTGLVVCAGGTDGRWALGSSAFGENDFALALVEADTGEQFGRWHSGSDGNDSFTFAGVAPDGSVSLGGYTYGDWRQGADADGAAAAAATVGEFVAIKFPPLDRDLVAPVGLHSEPSPAPRVGAAGVAATSVGLTQAPTGTRGSLRSSTPAPTSAAEVGGRAGLSAGSGGSGDTADWVMPVAVIGALLGFLLLCGCWCCFKRFRKKKDTAKTSTVGEVLALQASPAPARANGAVRSGVTPLPPGHDGALQPSSPAGIDAPDLHDVDVNHRSDTPISAMSWIPTLSDTAFGRVAASTNGVKGVLTAGLAAAIYESDGNRTGLGGREADDGRDNVPASPPEIDLTDLVMDNNDYYTQVADGNRTLREAAAVVAVVAAVTTRRDKANAYRRNAYRSGYASFDTVDTPGAIDENDPAESEDQNLAEAAVSVAAAATAQTDSPGSLGCARAFTTRRTVSFQEFPNEVIDEVCLDTDKPSQKISGMNDVLNHGAVSERGVYLRRIDGGAFVDRGNRRRLIGGRSFQDISGVGGEGGGGGVFGNDPAGADDFFDDAEAMPLTPRSMPPLVSMSFSTSMDDMYGQQIMSPTDNDHDSTSYDRAWERQRRQRSSPRHSDDDDHDGISSGIVSLKGRADGAAGGGGVAPAGPRFDCGDSQLASSSPEMEGGVHFGLKTAAGESGDGDHRAGDVAASLDSSRTVTATASPEETKENWDDKDDGAMGKAAFPMIASDGSFSSVFASRLGATAFAVGEVASTAPPEDSKVADVGDVEEGFNNERYHEGLGGVDVGTGGVNLSAAPSLNSASAQTTTTSGEANTGKDHRDVGVEETLGIPVHDNGGSGSDGTVVASAGSMDSQPAASPLEGEDKKALDIHNIRLEYENICWDAGSGGSRGDGGSGGSGGSGLSAVLPFFVSGCVRSPSSLEDLTLDRHSVVGLTDAAAGEVGNDRASGGGDGLLLSNGFGSWGGLPTGARGGGGNEAGEGLGGMRSGGPRGGASAPARRHGGSASSSSLRSKLPFFASGCVRMDSAEDVHSGGGGAVDLLQDSTAGGGGAERKSVGGERGSKAGVRVVSGDFDPPPETE